MADTLYVHLYGGPGTGKSTTRALVFGQLKQLGWNVEEAPEFAKDLTWEKRGIALGYQPYVFGKQTYREHRLDGQVEAVISDTSPLLSLIYKPDPLPQWWWAFAAFVQAYYHGRDTLNILLTRDPERGYNASGRGQTEDEARAIDGDVEDLLVFTSTPYTKIAVDKTGNSHVNQIVDMIEDRLDSFPS